MKILDVETERIPVSMRVPLKFGGESVASVTCLRVCVVGEISPGKTAKGWGETPLSVTWVWPSDRLSYADRYQAMSGLTDAIADAVRQIDQPGHPLESGYEFLETCLPDVLAAFNRDRAEGEKVPRLAALVITSAFDIAAHDAFGVGHDVDTYATYHREFLNRDLSTMLESSDPNVDFAGKFVGDFLVGKAPARLPVWHLVGGLDPLDDSQRTGEEPDDGYPVTLRDWIDRDGLRCLKIKLRGDDADWDFRRLVAVGKIASEGTALSADFNCMVKDPGYVIDVLQRLRAEHAGIFESILYVEQPFPYDLEAHRIDTRGVSALRPLFLDESAHDWRSVRLGRELGWTGVALKTCKTQTGALLSACWAKAHGMPLMVQDLTNPMLAQIPHVRLAAHVGTIMGVESNGMQFYPDASRTQATVHPGLYRRRGGELDLSTLSGSGFGYRLNEMAGFNV